LFNPSADYPFDPSAEQHKPRLVSGHVAGLVFVDRTAGRGRAWSYLPRIRSLFESLDFPDQFVETGSAAELESAARHALSGGRRMLLAMGGDGTFRAVGNRRDSIPFSSAVCAECRARTPSLHTSASHIRLNPTCVPQTFAVFPTLLSARGW